MRKAEIVREDENIKKRKQAATQLHYRMWFLNVINLFIIINTIATITYDVYLRIESERNLRRYYALQKRKPCVECVFVQSTVRENRGEGRSQASG